MSVNAERVRREVGAESVNEQITEALAQAHELVTKYLVDNDVEPTDVPDAIRDKAVLAAAADAYYLADAPNGTANQQFDVGQGEIVSTPIRISRDPLRSAAKVLEMWVAPAAG